MNLLKVLGIRSKEKVDFVCLNIPDMSLRERAIAALESGDSRKWGGRRWNIAYLDGGGYSNAMEKCSTIFGVKPSSCDFKRIGAGWYHVEIEDLILMTQDYHEHFGMFYWLRIPCPYCENMVRGDKMFSSLDGLGEAIKMSGPHSEHFKDCPPWRTKCAERFGDSSLTHTMDYKDWEHVCAS